MYVQRRIQRKELIATLGFDILKNVLFNLWGERGKRHNREGDRLSNLLSSHVDI